MICASHTPSERKSSATPIHRSVPRRRTRAWPVGVEDARHADVDAIHPVVVEAERLRGALACARAGREVHRWLGGWVGAAGMHAR
eukprot:5273416-Pleurochrysis_carterae.AAC.1